MGHGLDFNLNFNLNVKVPFNLNFSHHSTRWRSYFPFPPLFGQPGPSPPLVDQPT